MKNKAIVLSLFCMLGAFSFADRLEVNTLTQCISKSDIIVMGTICDIVEGTNGFNTVVLWDYGCFKGNLTNEYAKIKFPSYAGYVSPSCIPVEKASATSSS